MHLLPHGGAAVRILVTGGAGFIGSHFIRRMLFARPDVQIVNLDKLTYAGNLENLNAIASDPRYTFFRGDVCAPSAVDRALIGCSSVVHFAAESHVDRSIYDPIPHLQTNVAGTLTLLQAARQSRIARFIQVSTDEVYGDVPPGESASESAPLAPNSPYAASKAAADLLVRSFARTYGVPTIIARPSNNYGPNQFPEKFVPLMISNALEGKRLPIYGDGKQERSWVHVEDTCAAIESILERGTIGETYNISGSGTETNLAIAGKILALARQPATLMEHIEDRPGHDRRYALNSEKIGRELGWKPSIAVAQGLAATMDWYRANTEWMDEIRRGEYRSYYEKYYANRKSSLESIRRPPSPTENN